MSNRAYLCIVERSKAENENEKRIVEKIVNDVTDAVKWLSDGIRETTLVNLRPDPIFAPDGKFNPRSAWYILNNLGIGESYALCAVMESILDPNDTITLRVEAKPLEQRKVVYVCVEDNGLRLKHESGIKNELHKVCTSPILAIDWVIGRYAEVKRAGFVPDLGSGYVVDGCLDRDLLLAELAQKAPVYQEMFWQEASDTADTFTLCIYPMTEDADNIG